MDKNTNRFSRQHFGGSEARAHEALEAHRTKLRDGVHVRVYRGRMEGVTGVVVDRGTVSELRRRIRTPEGLTLEVEAQNLEVISANNPWSKVFG